MTTNNNATTNTTTTTTSTSPETPSTPVYLFEPAKGLKFKETNSLSHLAEQVRFGQGAYTKTKLKGIDDPVTLGAAPATSYKKGVEVKKGYMVQINIPTNLLTDLAPEYTRKNLIREFKKIIKSEKAQPYSPRFVNAFGCDGYENPVTLVHAEVTSDYKNSKSYYYKNVSVILFVETPSQLNAMLSPKKLLRAIAVALCLNNATEAVELYDKLNNKRIEVKKLETIQDLLTEEETENKSA